MIKNALLKVMDSVIYLLGVCVFFLATNVALAKIEIDISGGEVRGIPTAVVPFKVIDGSGITDSVHNIVAADLRASGRFEPIDQRNFLSFPSRGEEVRFKDWRFINAEALVIGEIWVLGSDKYEVQFRIYDVAREQEIGSGKRIPNLRGEDLRTAAHIVSDHVYQAFTGRPGAFNSRIAYVKRDTYEYQRYRYRLMVADWDGYNPQEVYASWRPLLSPSWSPDSRRLAFVSFTKKGPVVQMLELASGKKKTIASFKGVNAAPAWSPDGTKLAYSSSRYGSPDVYVYDFESKEHKRINTHYAIDTEPAWSPDGNSLLFTSNRTGKPQIYRTNLLDGSASRITFEGDENANASFDFDGKRIVLVHDGGRIAVVQEQNSEITTITNAQFDESPSFSPNGDMVLYATEQGYEPAMMVASADGRVKTRLEFVKGDVREPAWSPLRK